VDQNGIRPETYQSLYVAKYTSRSDFLKIKLSSEEMALGFY